ncbi:MAG: autotransporter outer membrane beta-barrel domain-containing protein [Pseudomonadota bacterium]
MKTATRALMAGALTLGAASIAAAQTASYGPASTSVSGGGSVTVNLSVPSSVTGAGSLNITYFGDFGGTSEFLGVTVEGTSIGTLPGGFAGDCAGDGTATLAIPAPLLASAAADGTVSITFTDTSGFVNNFCGTDNSATFNFDNSGIFSGSTAFAVQGTLNFTAAMAPPGSATAEGDMMASRGSMILGNSISTPRRVQRLVQRSSNTQGALSFQGTTLADGLGLDLNIGPDALSFASGTDAGGAMLWVEGRIARLSDDVTDDNRFGILHLGADVLVAPDVMLGFAASLETYRQEEIASGDDYSGTGWLLGPVLTARLHQNVFLDGRLAYGQSSNDIQRAAGEDSFDSHRRLAEIAVIGDFQSGATTIFPEFELSYFEESSESYASVAGGTVAGADVALGQARIGAAFERALPSASGDLTGYAELFGVFTSLRQGSVATGSYIDLTRGWTGEAALGLRYATRSGATISGNIGVGGLFSDGSSTSATIEARIPLQ